MICAITHRIPREIAFEDTSRGSEGRNVILQASDAKDLTYRELGGTNESAFAGFLRVFADSDLVRKLAHLRKRPQNKGKNDPSRIEGVHISLPIQPLNINFYPALFVQSGQHSTPDDKILVII